ncbi:MAG: flagellar hook-basal body complex protein, partial [Spirochaetes bacterium]|nr:flagellar hook-basal body complex protein [Spirochaetota bacterium]
MSLSSSLFSGISGLTTLGNAMQIIGDNIANVNTVGFKSSSFTFQDLLSQSVATLSGTSQVGRGTALGDIHGNFQQGSFESTGNTTDLAIGGAGFFVLKEDGTQNYYYSRAGNFSFNESGYLTNPEGNIVQGWELDSNGEDSGSIDDIVMSSFTSAPQLTSNIEVIVNLDSDGDDNSSGADNSIAAAWDGSATTNMGDNAYEYQTTMRCYDSLGSTHDVTLYFDKAATSSAYEFIVTCNPDEDFRTFGDSYETSTVKCAADVAGSLNNTYFEFSEVSTGDDYYVWYNVAAGGTDPGLTGKTGIEVAIATGATANTVASTTQTALDGVVGKDYTPTVATDTVTIVNDTAGAAT